MKLPAPVLSHQLAHTPSPLTEPSLRSMLQEDANLGFSGMVVVPALIDPAFTPEAVAGVFKETGMTGLVCGFNAGNGPDPLGSKDEADAVIASLEKQAQYAVALANDRVGPPVLVGPTHTLHMKKRVRWEVDQFNRWLDEVERLARIQEITFLFEPLNPTEDGTPAPFIALKNALRGRGNMGIHYDTGHARAWNASADTLRSLAPHIGYFELANVGRHPLREKKGISFPQIKDLMPLLPSTCVVGVEPFDPAVIEAFNLNSICTTRTSGKECLGMDASYLREIGVMQ